MEWSNLVTYMVEKKASDLHLTTNYPPIYRINGRIYFLKSEPLTKENILKLFTEVMTDTQMALYVGGKEVDMAISLLDVRLRINAFQSLDGPCAVLRIIPSKVLSLEELNAPEILKEVVAKNEGLVLITGPTGSGKSTTMSAVIDYINHNFSRHIITLEDPIETVHQSDKCLITQREVGKHTNSFEQGLKNCLREAPDVILVGELRSLETISAALSAAETGHMVIATLHTNSAAQTINRIVEIFPGDEQALIKTMLAASLKAVVSQRLVPTADNKSRVGAYEIMIGTKPVSNLIREGQVTQISSMIKVNSRQGMILMEDSIKALYEKGVISEETAILYNGIKPLTVNKSQQVIIKEKIQAATIDDEDDD